MSTTQLQRKGRSFWVDKTVKNNDLAAYTQRFQELTMLCTKMVPEEENRVEKFIGGYAMKNVENKNKFDNNQKDNRGQQPPVKRHNVGGIFLLNNRYASILFDSGADQNFVSTTFSTLHDIIPDTLDVSYAVELANRRTSETNTVLRGYTLGLSGYPFNIDLIPVELGSFDVIIGMDWLANHHAVIVCDEKIVRIPYKDEFLIVQGMGVEVATSDIREDEKEFEVEASVGGMMEIAVDPLEVPLDRITKFETTQRQLEAGQLVASGERAGLADRVRSLGWVNLRVRALLCIERDRVDSLRRHMALSQEEFC
nr:putative reverse transcriptase domain-containing protein [Tanacetum cinerariifolium]